MTEWHGEALMQAIREQAAEGLLAAAVHYSNSLMQKVSRPSPFFIGPRGGRNYYDPSKEGEYPKLRTGAGQKAITHQPETVQEVVQCGYVRVGYVEGDHHLLALEFAQRRKGLIDLLTEMRPQLAALALASYKDAR
jgi:hypothetical protein